MNLPKKKITTQRQRGQTPGSYLSLKLFNLFPTENSRWKKKKRKKNKGFSTRISKLFTIFQDIPSLIHANEFSPPLLCIFFDQRYYPFTIKPSKICFFVGNDGAPRSWPPSESVTIIILTEAISYTGCRF